MDGVWMDSAAAIALLKVQPQTLYANVSRGRIRTRPDPKDPRRSLYRRADVERLAARPAGRRAAKAVAEDAIAWGEPILPSAISTIRDGRLWYRGREAGALARDRSVESVAALLWEVPHLAFPPARIKDGDGAGLRAAFQALGRRAAKGLPSCDRAPAVLKAEAAELVGLLASALVAPGKEKGTVLAAGIARDLTLAERLAAAWGRAQAAEALRRALILIADHELNASTFAVRVAASTGAPLAACLLAGLATLTGPRHGRAPEQLFALLASARELGVEPALRRWLAQGLALPGFGHPLYPQGDPRGRLLLDGIAVPPVFASLAGEGEAMTGEKPNVDFALAVLTASFGLPAETPLLIFALGRSIGWIAHALEQAESGVLIRPRARYTGPVPGEAAGA